MNKLLLPSALLVVAALGSGLETSELVGTRPPEWKVSNWINSKKLRLEDLRGKVVLVRWWTAPFCPFCTASAPALNEFFNVYKDRGLLVIGFYHHKAATPLHTEQVKTYADQLGFEFPVAIDPQWRTLRRWWLIGNNRSWTSVSFLIDRQGVIRYIHPGGQYVKGDADYKRLVKKIEQLLDGALG